MPDSELRFKCHLLSVTFSDHPLPCHGISHSILWILSALYRLLLYYLSISPVNLSHSHLPWSRVLGDRNCHLHLSDPPCVYHIAWDAVNASYRFVEGIGRKFGDKIPRVERQTTTRVLISAHDFLQNFKQVLPPPSSTTAFKVEPSGATGC